MKREKKALPSLDLTMEKRVEGRMKIVTSLTFIPRGTCKRKVAIVRGRGRREALLGDQRQSKP